MKSTRIATDPFILSEQELADLVLEQTDAAILICDNQMQIVLANPTAQKFYNGNPVGLAFPTAFPLLWRRQDNPVNAPYDNFSLEPTLQGEILNGLGLLERPGMPRRELVIHSAPVHGPDQDVLCCIVSMMDISELRHVQTALAQQGALLDLSPDAINVHRLDGPITYWNRGAQNMYGWTAAETLGKNSHELLETQFPISRAAQEETLLAEGHWEGELQHRTRSGEQIVVASQQILQCDEQGRPFAILEINQDISERTIRERAQQFLIRATAELSAVLDFEITLKNIAQLAVPDLADWSAVHILSDDGIVRRLAFAHRDPAEVGRVNVRPSQYPLDETVKHLVPYVIRTGKTEFFNDVTDSVLRDAARDQAHLETLEHLGLHAYVCIPLQARGRMLGAVTFAMSDSGRTYSAGEVELAQELVRRAGLAADNAWLYLQERTARQDAEANALRVSALQNVTAAIAVALAPEQVARIALEQALPALSARAGSVSVLNPNGETIDLVQAIGYDEEIVNAWREYPISSLVPLARVIQTGETILLSGQDALLAEYPAISERETHPIGKAWAAVPLRVQDRIVGSLGLTFAQEREFSAQDKALMNALAQQCAQAMERARLYQAQQTARAAAEENAARISSLQDVTAALAATLTREQVRQVILEQGMRAFQAHGSLLAQLDDDGQTIKIINSIGYPAEQMPDAPIPIERNAPLADAIRQGELLVFQSLEEFLMRYPDRRDRKLLFGAWMFIPLELKGKVLGGVVLSFSDARPISVADRAFAIAFAQQCAQALERARLYESELQARQGAEQAAARSEWLTQASHVLSGSLDYQTTLKELAQLVVSELADWCTIDMAKGDGTAEQLIFTHRDPEKLKRAIAYGEEIKPYFTPDWNAPIGLPNVLRTGKAEIYYDIPDSLIEQVTKNEVQFSIVKSLGYRSVIIVPLNIPGKTLGAITMVNTDSDRHFTDDDLAFAELFAGRAAISVENARLYRETQALNTELERRVQQRTYELSRAYDELTKEVVERTRAEETTRALLRISNKLNSTLDVETALDILIQEAIRVMNGNSGFVGLRTPRGMQIHKFYANGKSVEIDFCWSPGKGMPGWVLEHAKPYVTNDAQNDPVILHDLPFNANVQTAICTPILDAQNGVIGFFEIRDKNFGEPFTGTDVEFLMALSPIASIALENAQAYQKISGAEKAVQDSYGQFRALVGRLQTIREEERTDISRELHDELGQALTALKMDLAVMLSRLPTRNKELRERAESMSQQIDTTIKTVRRMSSQLRPGMLDDLGLGPSIEWYAQEFQARTGIVVTTNTPPEELNLDRIQATALFRIFQETLTNVARHAHATQVQAKLDMLDHTLTLEISDNGQGIDLAQVRGKHSLGLLGMRERAETAHGTLEIRGAPGQGTTVLVRVPMDESVEMDG